MAISTDRTTRDALDTELRALTLIERLGTRESTERDLAQLGATPLQVRKLHPILSMLVYLRLHTYAISDRGASAVFIKRAVESYPMPLPERATKLYEHVRPRTAVDEIAVFEDLADDPYLAVRIDDRWFALYHWDVRPQTRVEE